jgi:hypothetical protein
VNIEPAYPERLVENARSLSERVTATSREKRQAAKFLMASKDFSNLYDILETEASRNKLLDVLQSAAERKFPTPEKRNGSTPSGELRERLWVQSEHMRYVRNEFLGGTSVSEFAEVFTPAELERLADVANDIPGERAVYVVDALSKYYAGVQKAIDKTAWMAPSYKQSYVLACMGLVIASILKARRKRRAQS